MSPELVEIFTGLAAGTLTVSVVSAILYYLPSQVDKNQKRLIAIGSSLCLGVLGFLGLISAGINEQPMGFWPWVSALWPVFTGAYTASQVVLSTFKTIWAKATAK